jgi:hypothetical protein
MRWINNVVAEIPIPHCSSENKLLVTKIVDKILTAKKSDPSADTTALEAEIEHLVYKLYYLTPEEIAIVEGSRKAGERPAPLAGKSKDDKPAKKTPKKRKPKLPPSLPGWD